MAQRLVIANVAFHRTQTARNSLLKHAIIFQLYLVTPQAVTAAITLLNK
jgi:hypothetical protein